MRRVHLTAISAVAGPLLIVAALAGARGGRAGAQKRPSTPGRFVNRTSLWERGGRDVLTGFGNMYNFRVLHEPGTPYPYRAWFFGWASEDCNRNVRSNTGCDAIFAARARSLDGPWEVWSGDGTWDTTNTPSRWLPVVSAQHTYYDEWHNGDPSVVKVRGRYYMAYSANGHNKDRKPYGSPGDTDGSFDCVMGAVSDDGIHWQRSPAPILAQATDFGTKPDPNGDAHVNGSYLRPSLLYEGGRFRLWFDYWTGKGVAMGCAENRGAFLRPADWHVVRAGGHPCLPEMPNPNIVHVGGVYLAYGDPSGYDTRPWYGRKLAEAASLDGVTWRYLGYVDPDPGVAATHVPESLVVTRGGHRWLYVFYACQAGGDPYDYRYKRIRWMRRRVDDADMRAVRSLLLRP